jgi:hypothetical protein
MSYDEAEALLRNKEDDFVNQWNQTRYICYSIRQSQTTILLKPSDILSFPWENEGQQPISKTKAELIQYAQEQQKTMN